MVSDTSQTLKNKNVTTIYIFESVGMTHVMEYLQTNVESFVHGIQQSNATIHKKDVSCGLCWGQLVMYPICVCVLRFSCYQCVGLPYEHHHFNVSNRTNDYYSNTTAAASTDPWWEANTQQQLCFELYFAVLYVLSHTCTSLYLLYTVCTLYCTWRILWAPQYFQNKLCAQPEKCLYRVCVCVCVRACVRVCSVKSPPLPSPVTSWM